MELLCRNCKRPLRVGLVKERITKSCNREELDGMIKGMNANHNRFREEQTDTGNIIDALKMLPKEDIEEYIQIYCECDKGLMEREEYDTMSQEVNVYHSDFHGNVQMFGYPSTLMDAYTKGAVIGGGAGVMATTTGSAK